MADWLTGLLTGFNQRKGFVEQENMRQAEASRQREGAVLEALINSPDPQISSLAITGLLDSARPSKRKSGLSGWIGERESSPYLPQIQALINTPVTEQKTVQAGPGVSQGYMLPEPPPAMGGAALPAQSPTQPPGHPEAGQLAQVESAPPKAVEPYMTTDYQTEAVGTAGPKDLGPVAMDPRQPPPTMAQVTTSRPRQVFMTPEMQATATARGKAQGDVEGEVAGLVASGFGDAEARQLVKQNYLRRTAGSASPYAPVYGTDANGLQVAGVFDRTQGIYIDPITRQPIEGFIARSTGRGPWYGVQNEAFAQRMFNKRYEDLAPNEQAAVLDSVETYAQGLAKSRRLGAGQGAMESPLTAMQAQQTGAPIGATSASMAGQQVGTIQDQQKLRTLEGVEKQIEKIIPLLSILPRDADTIGGRAPGAVLASKRISDRAKVAELESEVASIVNNLAIVASGQRGTQTERDAERAYKALVDMQAGFLNPLGGDTVESATARIRATQQYLRIIKGAIPGAPIPNPGSGAQLTPSAPPPPSGITLDSPAVGPGGKRAYIENGQVVYR